MTASHGKLRPFRFLATLFGGSVLCKLLTDAAWVYHRLRVFPPASPRAQSHIQLRQQIVNQNEMYPSTYNFRHDEQQQKAIDAVMDGRHVLITGGAGVGKTATTNEILKRLDEKFGEDADDKVVVTTSTGVSAVLMGGCTLHCAAGISVPRFTSDFKKIRNQPYKQAWEQLEVLIIDEVSMISGEFFDQFEEQVRKLRNNDQPFGGLQLVLVGDFAQLPPVVTKPPAETWKLVDQKRLAFEKRAFIPKGPRSYDELFLNRGMLFQSESFWNLYDHDLQVISLTAPHRHHSDAELPDILRSLRAGSDSERRAAIKRLNARCYRPEERAPFCHDNEQVWLFSGNKRVDIENTRRLKSLPYKPVTFTAKDKVKPEESDNQTLFETRSQLLAKSSFFKATSDVPKEIVLKENAWVMLCANMDTAQGLVNGADGRVVKLSNGKGTNKQYVLVDFDDIGPAFINPYTFHPKIPGLGTCERKQIPLRLAWAITHHRSQGKTLSNVKVDPRAFAYGQAYVAVSRARSSENLRLLEPAKLSDFKVNPAVPRWMQYLQHRDLKAREEIGHWLDETLPWSSSKQRSPWPRRG